MSYSPETRPANRYQPWLWLLSGLFLLRVMAQLAALFVEIPYLPPFERWHSGTLPYGVLLACQLAILPVMLRVALGISFGRVVPVNGLGAILLPIGTAHRHFFEFVERDQWDGGDKDYLMIDELEVFKEYYILVTTRSGLYRYFINDIVKVTGFFERTPTMKFVQKGKGVTNITGEKLYEGQVMEAVKRAEASLHFNSVFYLMVADEEVRRYTLYLEPDGLARDRIIDVAEEIDNYLGQLNMEYRAKRASARLAPLEVQLLSAGSFDDYKRLHLSHGQREGQFKPVTLQYKNKVAFRLDQCLGRPDQESDHVH